MTCRDAILSCAAALTQDNPNAVFTPQDIIGCMKARGTSYAESTIRTHISSRMCGNAPDNHAVVYDDRERVDAGTYRLR